MSVRAPHPDERVVQIIAKGLHDEHCKCGSFPCGVPRGLALDFTREAKVAAAALLAEGYEWVDWEARRTDRAKVATATAEAIRNATTANAPVELQANPMYRPTKDCYCALVDHRPHAKSEHGGDDRDS